MTWRIDKDESLLSDAERIAWEFVLPYKHVPILREDENRVTELTRFLQKHFRPDTLRGVVNDMESKK